MRNINRVIRRAAVAPFFFAALLFGQMDSLTVQETKQIVQAARDIAIAKAKGWCPSLSVNLEGSSRVSIQARGVCESEENYGSGLINNYVVDRMSGVVTEGDNPRDVSTAAMKRLADGLFARADQRFLSFEEAKCLAVEAAHAAIGPELKTVKMDVQKGGPQILTRARFLVTYTFPIRSFSRRRFIVDTTTAVVQDEDTGAQVLSGGLADLTAKMLALHLPQLLTPEDALQIASQVPSLAAKIADGKCGLAADDGTANDVYIWLTGNCQGKPGANGPALAVNMVTGAITDPRSGKPIASPQGEEAAKRLLSKQAQLQKERRETIKARCGIQ